MFDDVGDAIAALWRRPECDAEDLVLVPVDDGEKSGARRLVAIQPDNRVQFGDRGFFLKYEWHAKLLFCSSGREGENPARARFSSGSLFSYRYRVIIRAGQGKCPNPTAAGERANGSGKNEKNITFASSCNRLLSSCDF
jgi:hypothetical protein